MAWEMAYCYSGDEDIVQRSFPTLEDGLAWLRENAPVLLKPGVFFKEGDEFRQWGTNYHWACFYGEDDLA